MTQIILILLQFILFIPFYLIWKKDCKEIGQSNLAVSLEERFVAWVCLCPIWAAELIF
jgi:hypothetical protein